MSFEDPDVAYTTPTSIETNQNAVDANLLVSFVNRSHSIDSASSNSHKSSRPKLLNIRLWYPGIHRYNAGPINPHPKQEKAQILGSLRSEPHKSHHPRKSYKWGTLLCIQIGHLPTKNKEEKQQDERKKGKAVMMQNPTRPGT
jgi:hypothetical protein